MMDCVPLISAADLVFVMGTSLKVFPFNMLVTVIKKDTPTVLVNFDDVMSSSGTPEKFLFLRGDIDSHIRKIVEGCGWSFS